MGVIFLGRVFILWNDFNVGLGRFLGTRLVMPPRLTARFIAVPCRHATYSSQGGFILLFEIFNFFLIFRIMDHTNVQIG